MRVVAVLLMLAGFGLAIGYPLYQADFTGEKIATLDLYDRTRDGNTNEWQARTVNLTEADNPVRIRLEGMRASGDSFIGSSLPVDIEVSGPEGIVLSTGLDMRLASDSESGNSSPNVADQRLYINAPDFDILAPGEHTISVSTPLERDISLMKMEAIVLARVERPTNEYTRSGIVLALVGSGLYVVGYAVARLRRKRGKKAKTKPRRWGRG